MNSFTRLASSSSPLSSSRSVLSSLLRSSWCTSSQCPSKIMKEADNLRKTPSSTPLFPFACSALAVRSSLGINAHLTISYNNMMSQTLYYERNKIAAVRKKTTTTTTAAKTREGAKLMMEDDTKETTTTHFGFQTVDITEKEGMVKEVFANVAESYDVMNDIMSAGIHRFWKDKLVSMTCVDAIAKAIRRKAVDYHHHHLSSSSKVKQQTSSKAAPKKAPPRFDILDVAGGTGDIAFRMVDAASCLARAQSSGQDEISVTVCDINPDMLRVGQNRARDKYVGGESLFHSGALRFVQGNAQSLPFENNSFDLYTIAFGLRNVTDVDAALKEANRVLRPGGRFLCLEFSHVEENVVLRTLYDAYSFNIIPMIGEVVAKDCASYQYLVESIRKFPNQTQLASMLQKAGFNAVRYVNMTGGIVAVHEGWKALSPTTTPVT